MSTPEDPIDTGETPQQGALAALQAPETSPEGREWGTNYLKAHPEGVDTRGEAALLQDFAANAEDARAALRQARERLASQRMDPRILGYNFAAAMLSPSRGGVPDQWSKAAAAMGDYAKQQQAFQQSQSAQDLALAEQLSGVDRQSLQARLALQELKERTQASMLGTALKATAQPVKPPGGHPVFKQAEAPDGMVQNEWVDPVTQTITPVGKPFKKGEAGVASDALATKISTYDAPPITGYALTRPGSSGGATMDKVFELNPGYSEPLYPQITAARRDLVSGQTRKFMDAVNTGINHLTLLDQAYDAMHNGDIKVLNKVKNSLGIAFESNQPAAVYDSIVHTVADEVVKATIATGGGVTDRNAATEALSRDFSSPTGHAVIQAQRGLLAGKVPAVQASVYANMGLPAFTEGTPEYDHHKAMIDREWNARLLPRTRAALSPAPAQAMADLNNPEVLRQHPDLRQQFKAKYGYLPEDLTVH